MALDKDARTVLFGTPMLSRQIRKCVQSKGSITESDLRAIFPDVGSNLYHKTLRQLCIQGVITRENGIVSYRTDAPEIQGGQADRAWRAACLLKSFRLDELCRIADIRWSYAQKLVSFWARSGAVMRLAQSRKGAPAIWVVKRNDAVRPVRR